jgi:hypothetical protein
VELRKTPFWEDLVKTAECKNPKRTRKGNIKESQRSTVGNMLRVIEIIGIKWATNAF